MSTFERVFNEDRECNGACARTLLERAVRVLAPQDPGARCDAEVLLGHVLGKPRHWPYVWGEYILSVPEYERFQALLDRRVAGWPVAYLTGRRAFWSLDLSVTPDVLIPRPETESLVESALEIIPEMARWRIADLGTGAGPVALTLARERPGCRITATDISGAALDVARKNAREHGLENVVFREGDWFDGLTLDIPPDISMEGHLGDPTRRGRNGTEKQESFGHSGRMDYDVIVSNPPYVAADDPHLRQGDVRFEPMLALVPGTVGAPLARPGDSPREAPEGGPHGCGAIAHIAGGAPGYLRPGGWLLLEHGYDQGERVRELLDGFGYGQISTRLDDGGRERVTMGRRRHMQKSDCVS